MPCKLVKETKFISLITIEVRTFFFLIIHLVRSSLFYLARVTMVPSHKEHEGQLHQLVSRTMLAARNHSAEVMVIGWQKLVLAFAPQWEVFLFSFSFFL